MTQGYTLTSISNALPSTGGTVTGATTFNSTVSINGANGSGYTGYKNRIINGGMVIDQRNAGASVTPATTGSFVYTLDRWSYYASQASKFSIQRNAASVTPPAGYTNYIGLTSTSSYTSVATDQFLLTQQIEGYNIADLAWGTASAATVTLSFWVRSSLTGQFSATLENIAGTRSYVATYTISSANTWEQKTLTIPGSTGGVWNSDNTIGMYVIFNLGDGSNFQTTPNTWYAGPANAATGDVKVVGTSGATFYVTGVQLERGSNATSFEFRDYGRELQMCQRYYSVISATGGSTTVVGYYTTFRATSAHPVTMRATPTVTAIASGTTLNLQSGPTWTALNTSCSEMAMAGNAVVGTDFYVRGATASASSEL